MKYGQVWMKKYAERSEAKKKYIKIKRGPKKLNFGASKPGVRGGGPGPLGPPPGSASENATWSFNELLCIYNKRTDIMSEIDCSLYIGV